MNWEAIGAIGEVVGGAVVVISLLYVARQIRQSTEQARMAAGQAVDTSNMQAWDPIYIPENSRIWTRGHSEPDALDDHERQMFETSMIRLFGASFSTTSYYHSLGMYDEALYQYNSTYYGSLLTTPGGQRWWQKYREILHPAAREQLDRVLATRQQRAARAETISWSL